MGGAVATPVVKAIGGGLIGGLQPTVFGFSLGMGYPLGPACGILATGATHYDTNAAALSSAAGSDLVGSHTAHTGVTAESFSNLAPNTQLFPTGGAYNVTFNGQSPPEAWAKAAGAPPHSLTFYKMIRVDRGRASLLDRARGSDFAGSVLTDFVTGAKYTQYLAWAVHVIFDSDCKRDLYVATAASNSLAALLPLNDTKGLGTLLVDAKATIRVHVIALGQAAAAQSIVDTTTCTTKDLAGCQVLVTKLTALTKTVGSAPLPATFAARQQGMSDWWVDTVTRDLKSSL